MYFSPCAAGKLKEALPPYSTLVSANWHCVPCRKYMEEPLVDQLIVGYAHEVDGRLVATGSVSSIRNCGLGAIAWYSAAVEDEQPLVCTLNRFMVQVSSTPSVPQV